MFCSKVLKSNLIWHSNKIWLWILPHNKEAKDRTKPNAYTDLSQTQRNVLRWKMVDALHSVNTKHSDFNQYWLILKLPVYLVNLLRSKFVILVEYFIWREQTSTQKGCTTFIVFLAMMYLALNVIKGGEILTSWFHCAIIH